MAEIKNSPPSINKQESFKPKKIERILNITKDCLEGKTTPFEAFQQIVGHNHQSTETLEPQKPVSIQNETEIEQQKTNQEIKKIRQEISTITEEVKTEPEPVSDSRESLIIKDEYYLQKEKEFKGKGFIDSHQTSYQKNLDSKTTISDKISSKISISKLKRLGVENPQEFYKVLNERGFSVKDMIKEKTVNTYLEMSPEEISKGIDRVEKLGLKVELYIPETKNCLKEISAISDDDFNNFASELNKYPFLNRALKENGENRLVYRIKDRNYNDKYLANPLFDKFIESAQNGQINPEIKKRLDILKEIQLLEEPKYKEKFPSLKDYSHFYEFTRKGSNSHLGGCQADILDIFNPNIKIDFKFPESKYLDQKIFNKGFDFIWENLNTISNSVDFFENLSEEQINKLHNNPNGVANFLKKVYTKTQGNNSCKNIIEYTVSNQDKINFSFNNETEQSNFFLDLVKKNSSDYSPDEYARHIFIRDLQEIGIYNISSFSNKKDQNYWNIISNVKNRELTISLIDQKDKFFNDDNSIKPYFFETFTKDYFHSFSSMFFLEYLDNETISKFPLKDKIIWSISSNFKENRSEQIHFLAKISELSEIINKTEFINPEFFDSVITECGEKCLRFGIFTDEVINNLPPKDKIIWNLYKDLNEFRDYHFNNKDEVIKVFMEIKENFSQYLDENNNLNSLFFEKIIREFTNNNNYYGSKDIINKYLTEQNIDKLNDQEKIFWNIYKDFPFGESEEKNVDLHRQRYDIRNFLINNRANFSSEYLNKKNQLKSSFMMAILKQNNNNEFNELKPLLTENILKNLIPSEKSFWKSYFDADIYNNKYREGRVSNIIREILIKRKEDYKKFFDTNHPTSDFLFELAGGLDNNKDGTGDYSGILKLNLLNVPDESFVNFSPQDKAFWIAYRDTFWINNESKFTYEYDGYSLRKLLLDNYSEFSKFIDKDFKLNNLFIESIIKNNIILGDRFLTEEKLLNFSSQDRKILEIIRANNNISFNRFIIDHKDQINDLFDNQNKPNFLFYKTITSEKIDLDNWKHLLTPEQIINFPEADQKIWTIVKTMIDKKCPNYILETIIDNQEKFDLYFNQEGLPTHIFLESLLFKNKNYYDFYSKSFIFSSLINQEIIQSFPESEKLFWNNLLKTDDLLKPFYLEPLFNSGDQKIINNPLSKLSYNPELSFFNQDKKIDIEITKYFNQQNYLPQSFTDLFKYTISKTEELLTNNNQIEINQTNWKSLLMFYIHSQDEDNNQVNQELNSKIKTLFEDPKTRNLCLSEMQAEWKSYLDSGNSNELPFSLKLLSFFIKEEGSGPLSQIESLGLLINTIDNNFSKKNTVAKTKNEIIVGLSEIESNFIKNKWSNENKTDFYNISRDIIDAAPSLFSDYLTLFKKLSPSELKQFSEEIYPLYKTKLILIEKENNYGNKYYEKDSLLNLRKDIRSFNGFDLKKEELLKDIKERFSTRFEITKIPENFTPENIRSIKDISMYLSNIAYRTPEKEAILGFYLSLNINNLWDDFRSGKEINPRDYLSENKSVIVENFLKEREKTTKAIIESVGIEDENIPEFIKLLQSETQNLKIGDVETIDIKLNNIIQNLNELQDLDLYPDPLDKQRMNLLQTWGNKEVGSTVAKIYQQLSNPGKNISLSENETKIKQQLIEICQAIGLDSDNPQVLKENFQDGIRALSTLVNMSSFVEKIDALGEIDKLRKDLEPTPEIIEIFQRIGEDFKVNSGAMALSQDLDYLNNLLTKKENLIIPKEKEILSKYISTIKNQVLSLEETYGQIKSKFENLKQGSSNSKNELLNQKLKEIETIINSQSTQQVITSTATNNLNIITENMRACLACTNKGCNNDTDLTFGDINKFYLYSQSENQSKGSISDQLAYFEPIIRENGSQEVSFVIDVLYGLKTPSILENQVEAIIKKARIIKQRFSNAKTSVFVSSTALSSSGTPNEMLIRKLQESKISAQVESVEVDVIKSAAADHYIEIGGDARTAGKRKVSGIIINI